MRFRPFEAADLAPVQQVIHRTIDSCYSGVYPPRAVRFFREFHSLDRILERHAAGNILVAEEDGVVMATGAIVEEEITGVFVHPEFQNRGIGGQVMDRLEDIARAGGHPSTRLSVSLPSRDFYENRGYKVFESRSIDVGEGERLDYWAAEKSLGQGKS
ncbi:MAG: GNAT family N-acetyltransferase [Actinomycetota bacterium]|nr:GNAT family N-acetyltransferase [Actinomycetota bacterium]